MAAEGGQFSLGDAVLNLVGDSTSLNKALGDADKAVNDKVGNITKKLDSLGKGMTLAGTAILGGIGGVVATVAEAADNISEMSDRMGVGAEAVQVLGYQAGQTGGSIEDVEKAINKMSKGMLGFSEDADKVDAKAAANAQKLSKTVSDAQKKLGEARSQASTQYNTTVATAEATYQKAINKSGLTSAQVSAAQIKYSQTVSKAKETYAERVKNAEEKVGAAQKKLADESGASAEVSSKYALALGQIGLKAEDLFKLSPEEKFKTIGVALGEVKDPTQKSALALELFGKSGTKLLNMFKDGQPGLKATEEELRKMGGVMSNDTIQATKELADAWSALKPVLISSAAEIVKSLFPMLMDMRQHVVNMIGSVNRFVKAHPQLVAGLLDWGLKIGGFLTVAGPIVLFLSQAIRGIVAFKAVLEFKSVASAVGWIAKLIGVPGGAGFVGLLGAIGAIVAAGAIGWEFGRWIDKMTSDTKFGHWIDDMMDKLVALIAKLKEWFGMSEKAGPELGDHVTAGLMKGKYTPAGVSKYAGGTNYHAGGLAMVGERGRELVMLPRGSQVKTNQDTERLLAGMNGAGGGDVNTGDIHVTIQAGNTDPRQWKDIDFLKIRRGITNALRVRTA